MNSNVNLWHKILDIRNHVVLYKIVCYEKIKIKINNANE